MKKLKLNQANFAGGEVLTRAQLRKVMGGDFGSTTGSGEEDTAFCTYTFVGGSTESGVVTNPPDSGFASAADFARDFCGNDNDCVSVSCTS